MQSELVEQCASRELTEGDLDVHGAQGQQGAAGQHGFNETIKVCWKLLAEGSCSVVTVLGRPCLRVAWERTREVEACVKKAWRRGMPCWAHGSRGCWEQVHGRADQGLR